MVLAHPFGEKCTVSIKQWRSYAPPPPIPCCQAEQGLAGTQDLPLSPISPRLLPQPAPLARAVSACLDLLCSYCAHFPLFHGFGSNMCHYRIFCACFPRMLQEDHFSMKSVLIYPPAPLIACLSLLRTTLSLRLTSICHCSFDSCLLSTDVARGPFHSDINFYRDRHKPPSHIRLVK